MMVQPFDANMSSAIEYYYSKDWVSRHELFDEMCSHSSTTASLEVRSLLKKVLPPDMYLYGEHTGVSPPTPWQPHRTIVLKDRRIYRVWQYKITDFFAREKYVKRQMKITAYFKPVARRG